MSAFSDKGLAQSFDDGERMRPSRYYELVADVMDELVKFTLLTHCFAMSFDGNPASDVALVNRAVCLPCPDQMLR